MAFLPGKVYSVIVYPFIVLLISAVVFTGCAPARFVKPLDKGQNAVTASLGGPLIAYGGSNIPIPLSSLTFGHGFRSSCTGFIGLHTTALAFGVVQTEFGAVKRVLVQNGWRPGISIAPTANFMYDKWEHQSSFFPQIDAHAYWRYSKRPHYVYLGMSNWFDNHNTRAEGEPQKIHWVPALQLGHTLVRHGWDYTLELKYIAPGQSNKDLVVDYQSLGKTGAMGIYIGITKKK